MKINGKKFKIELEKKAVLEKVSVLDIKKSIMAGLDIDRQTLSYWCSGKHKPATEKLIFLRDFFKLEKVDDLLM